MSPLFNCCAAVAAEHRTPHVGTYVWRPMATRNEKGKFSQSLSWKLYKQCIILSKLILEVADLWVGFLVSIIQLSPLHHWPLYYSAKFWAQSPQGRATMDKWNELSLSDQSVRNAGFSSPLLNTRYNYWHSLHCRDLYEHHQALP